MRRWWWVDLGMWVGVALPAVGVDRVGLNEPRGAWAELAGLAALGGAVVLWRRRPLGAFGVAAALGLISAPSLFTLSYGPALALFALLMGRRAPYTRPALLAFGAIAVLGSAKILVRGVDPVVEWLVLMGTLLFGAVFPWLAGRYWRQGRELAAAGWARAGQLEREQRIVADRARLRERTRIAQDMHDSLGHELSLIAVRAGALQVAADLPDRHRAAAADLRAAASDATDRLHEIIGLLREAGDETAPLAPAGETVAELVERAAGSGLPVHYIAGGDATTAELTGTESGRTVHRVVQEALTNAARHAPGAEVTVETATDAAGITVTVTNGPAQQPAPASGGGSGLLGLRARAADLGGTLDAGPHGDGFRVVARLPARGGEPAPAATPRGSVISYARRRTLLGFGAAVATGVLLVGGAFAWYVYSRSNAVLEPADFARLRIGQPQQTAERLLPDRVASDPPSERAPTPPPAGADCRYYRAGGELFVTVEHFRVCFDGGVLVEKSVIPRAGGARKASEEEEEEKEEEKEWVR
ncbi:sensor histidine kinase [Streptomyces sp. NPDC050658]|uniref:sensor histidine kinase n=1 Tax=unclassified Streptomyces TaxID=2593676 RepID=UPI00341CC05B